MKILTFLSAVLVVLATGCHSQHGYDFVLNDSVLPEIPQSVVDDFEIVEYPKPETEPDIFEAPIIPVPVEEEKTPEDTPIAAEPVAKPVVQKPTAQPAKQQPVIQQKKQVVQRQPVYYYQRPPIRIAPPPPQRRYYQPQIQPYCPPGFP